MRHNCLKYILILVMGIPGISPAKPTSTYTLKSDTAVDGGQSPRRTVVRKDTVAPYVERPEDRVIVGGDTISMIIPEKNYGRFDRGLFNYLYIPKGSWSFGLTASYGSLDTRNIQALSVVDNLNFDGEIYSIHPSVAWFVRHNQSLGLRMIYTHGHASLGSMGVDLGDDLSFSLHDVGYRTNKWQMGAFYRNYVGLDRGKRFAVFNEVALDCGLGRSHFSRYYGDELYDTRTTTTSVSLNFSPGLCVFIQEYVAFNVSFGVFGVKMDHEHQYTNGVDEGTRFSSGANFRFNIFNINFGLLVVI